MSKPIDLNPGMTAEERIEAVLRVSMKDKDHLKRWLRGSGRQWLVFNALDLVDALRWPDGIDVLMQIVASYRDHRSAIETGRFEQQKHPQTGELVEVPVCKGEDLEIEEIDRAIRWLVAKALEKDPRWTLNNEPM